MSNRLMGNLVNIFVFVMLPIYISIHVLLLPYSVGTLGVNDPGFISIMTLTVEGCLFVTLLTILFNPQLNVSRLTVVMLTYIAALYFFREADFHKLFTEIHVTRAQYFALPNVPWWHKLLIALMYVFLFGSLYYLLRNYARLVWRKVSEFEPWAVAMFLWFFLLLTSQASDRLGFNHIYYAKATEEISECWAALFLLLAAIQIIPSLKRDGSGRTMASK